MAIKLDDMIAALKDRVTYTIITEPEDDDPAGHFASGDDAADRKLVDSIRKRVRNGDEWAWCRITVTASFHGIVGEDHLGGCSCEDEADFRTPGGYFDDMQHEALSALASELCARALTFEELGFKITRRRPMQHAR